VNVPVKIIIITFSKSTCKIDYYYLSECTCKNNYYYFSKSTCKIDYYYFSKTNYYFSKSTCKNDYTGPDIPNNRILLKHQVRLNCNRLNF